MKENIRPIYSGLKGYLVVVSDEKNIWDEAATSICDQLNETIDELNSVTGQDYSRFKVNTRVVSWNFGTTRIVVDTLVYKNNLSGLINRIQGEFFSDEPTSPNQTGVVINNNQTQSQTQTLAITLEFQEKLLSQIPKYAEGTKEKSFLEKLKSSLSSVKTLTDILSNVLKIGGDLGLNPATIHTLLGL